MLWVEWICLTHTSHYRQPGVPKPSADGAGSINGPHLFPGILPPPVAVSEESLPAQKCNGPVVTGSLGCEDTAMVTLRTRNMTFPRITLILLLGDFRAMLFAHCDGPETPVHRMEPAVRVRKHQ